MDYKEAAAKYQGKLWLGEIKGHAGDPDYIDESKLVKVNSGEFSKLIEPAAKSFLRMVQATNNQPSMALGNKTYRPIGLELEICNDPKNKGKRTPTSRNPNGDWCDGVNKAKPGNSIHGWGRAVDFQIILSAVGLNQIPSEGTAARKLYDWLCQNALDYGWVNYLAEAWHWEYVGEPPGKYVNPALVKSVPGDIPPIKQKPGSIVTPPSNEDNNNDSNQDDEKEPSEEGVDDGFEALDMNEIWNNTSVEKNKKVTNEGTNKATEKDPEIVTILNPDKKALAGEGSRDKQTIDINKK